MAMMPIVADVYADIVQKRREFQPFPFAIAEPVHAPRLIKNAQRQACDLLRMLGPVAAAFAEFDDAATSDVGVALDLANAGAIAVDVVEDEAFAKREVAEREITGAEAAQDRVEQHRAGDVQ